MMARKNNFPPYVPNKARPAMARGCHQAAAHVVGNIPDGHLRASFFHRKPVYHHPSAWRPSHALEHPLTNSSANMMITEPMAREKKPITIIVSANSTALEK
jgi:hypothetical protein